MTGPPLDHPKAREDVIFRPLDDEWVVYDPRDQSLHVLNRSAALIWLHCTGESTVHDVVKNVIGDFDEAVSRDRVQADVEKILADFAAKGLLE